MASVCKMEGGYRLGNFLGLVFLQMDIYCLEIDILVKLFVAEM